MISITNDINEAFKRAFVSEARYLHMYGSAGAGKSYAAAQKLLINTCNPNIQNNKLYIIRKSFPSLRRTCWEMIDGLYKKYKLHPYVNKTSWEMAYKSNRIMFSSLDDYNKIMSITDVNKIWIEEPTDLTETEFNMIDMRLRGEEVFGYRQIILTYNPINPNHWLKKRFHDVKDPKAEVLHYTYRDNKYLDKDSVELLEGLKEKNYYLWKIYAEGQWEKLEGLIFPEYTLIDDMPDGEGIYGLDYGFTEPSALNHIIINENNLYIDEILYETNLTNNQLIERMRTFNMGRRKIIADCAEPNRIEEMHKAGFNIHPCKKGQDSVRYSIDSVKNYKIHITKRSINTIKEFQGYVWQRDKNDKALDGVPVDFNNHSVDSTRYAVYTTKGKSKLYFAIARKK